MNMDNMKLFTKFKNNWRIEKTVGIYSEDIEMEFEWKMCPNNNEKREKRSNRKNITAKSGKY